MYFPYLRGRQFELLAVRELVVKKLIGGNVLPIIEPVHLTSTLIKTLEVCASQDQKIGLVINPRVGTFAFELNEKQDQASKVLAKKFAEFVHNPGDSVIPTIILKQEDYSRAEEELARRTKVIAVCDTADALSFYAQANETEKKGIIYNLIPDESRFKRNTRGLPNVLFEDNFNKQPRNADYAVTDDEPYSDEFKFYKVDGFRGFGDYSIVGKEYKESGFAPYAVAIHIIYRKGEELRIHHFVSDTNDDITDVAGKFGEAVRKLVKWNQKTGHLSTEGIKEFERLEREQVFPGLGTVKKLSIMHHLQLMEELEQGR